MPGESWDCDQPHESMLMNLVIDGEPRRAPVHTSKIGWGLVPDRETGEFLSAFRTGYDNVVLGWSPEGRPVYNPEVEPTEQDQTLTACPHLHGTRDLHSSSLATAGGIVFGGTSDRWLFALDSETGELLWEMRLNGDISGSPVTFTVNGRQYVAVGADGRIAQTMTLGPLVDIDIPLGSGVMWVFALPEAR